jgi:flagellar biosynthesis protein FlhG
MSAILNDQASDLRRLMATQEATRAAPREPRTVAARADVRLTARPVDSSRRSRSGAHVIAIASGKGGVGKTHLAVNLAILLSQAGRRVVLVDADLGTANVDVMMNVQPRHDLSHVLRRERTVDEVAVRINRHLRLIAGASGLGAVADLSPHDRDAMVDQFARLESQSDVILLDCGAGISQNVLTFSQCADELLAVTTPEPTALTDVYSLIKVLSRTERTPRMGLVVNQVDTEREGRLVADRLVSVASRFLGVDLAQAGQVLRDAHVSLAIRQRSPLVLRYPNCPAASGLSTLARRIARGHGGAAEKAGFFRRAISLFY